MLTITEIKAQIEAIKHDLTAQSKTVKKADTALNVSIAKLQYFETRFSTPDYHTPRKIKKEHEMQAECMTVEEQIQALRDGYELRADMFGEVYFYKMVETIETPEQFETRITSDRVFHQQFIDKVDALKLNANLAKAEFTRIKERLDQYVQLQRQYYATTFGVK